MDLATRLLLIRASIDGARDFLVHFENGKAMDWLQRFQGGDSLFWSL